MRRYDDPVDVRRGRVSGTGSGPVEGPEQFLWRGRLWKVRQVVAHWVETGPWWQSRGVHAVLGDESPPTWTSTGPVAGTPAGTPPGHRWGRPDRTRASGPGRRAGGLAGRGRRGMAAAGRDRPGGGPVTAEVTAAASSTWSSTGPTAAGASPGAWTERESDDRADTTDQPPGTHDGSDRLIDRLPDRDRPRSTSRPRRTPTSSGRPPRSRRRSPPPRSRCATPAPTSRRCGPPPRCSPRGPPDAGRAPRQAAEERLGAARRGRPGAREWAAFFSAGRPSVPPPRRGPAVRSPSGRPTTWSGTPTASSAWSRSPWG